MQEPYLQYLAYADQIKRKKLIVDDVKRLHINRQYVVKV